MARRLVRPDRAELSATGDDLHSSLGVLLLGDHAANRQIPVPMPMIATMTKIATN
jgi:hypothetical protein